MSRWPSEQEIRALLQIEESRKEKLLVDQAFAAFMEDFDPKWDIPRRIFAAGWYANNHRGTQAERLGPNPPELKDRQS